MRTIFLEKSFSKCGGETIPRPFSKNSKCRGLSNYIKMTAADHLLLPHIKLFA